MSGARRPNSAAEATGCHSSNADDIEATEPFDYPIEKEEVIQPDVVVYKDQDLDPVFSIDPLIINQRKSLLIRRDNAP